MRLLGIRAQVKEQVLGFFPRFLDFLVAIHRLVHLLAFCLPFFLRKKDGGPGWLGHGNGRTPAFEPREAQSEIPVGLGLPAEHAKEGFAITCVPWKPGQVEDGGHKVRGLDHGASSPFLPFWRGNYKWNMANFFKEREITQRPVIIIAPDETLANEPVLPVEEPVIRREDDDGVVE